MADSVYRVHVTTNPTVQFEVPRGEYEYLVRLGLILSLDEVVVPADKVLIQTTDPVGPTVGQVWFNPNIG